MAWACGGVAQFMSHIARVQRATWHSSAHALPAELNLFLDQLCVPGILSLTLKEGPEGEGLQVTR